MSKGGEKVMRKKVLTGIKIFALVSIISVFSGVVMQPKQMIGTKPTINIVKEVPDNLGGVVFYGISPYTLEK